MLFWVCGQIQGKKLETINVIVFLNGLQGVNKRAVLKTLKRLWKQDQHESNKQQGGVWYASTCGWQLLGLIWGEMLQPSANHDHIQALGKRKGFLWGCWFYWRAKLYHSLSLQPFLPYFTVVWSTSMFCYSHLLSIGRGYLKPCLSMSADRSTQELAVLNMWPVCTENKTLVKFNWRIISMLFKTKQTVYFQLLGDIRGGNLYLVLLVGLVLDVVWNTLCFSMLQ